MEAQNAYAAEKQRSRSYEEEMTELQRQLQEEQTRHAQQAAHNEALDKHISEIERRHEALMNENAALQVRSTCARFRCVAAWVLFLGIGWLVGW